MSKESLVARLTEIFEAVEPALRANRIASYRATAESQTENWRKRVTGEIAPPEKPAASANRWGYTTAYDKELRWYMEPGRYVFPGVASYHDLSWDRLTIPSRHGVPSPIAYASVADKIAPKYDLAEKDANNEVDFAKAGFLSKFKEKLSGIIEGHGGVAKVSGSLSIVGRIVGVLRVEFENGDSFVVNMSIIWKTSNRGTHFNQYPARFNNIVLNGVRKNAASEKWMKENFGAGSSAGA